MTQAMHYPDTATLKKWFYYAAVGFVLWPVLMFVALMTIYKGQLAPSYTSPFIEQLPVLIMAALQLIIELILIALSVMLALRVVTTWKKPVFLLVALVALLFASKSLYGIINYVRLVS